MLLQFNLQSFFILTHQFSHTLISAQNMNCVQFDLKVFLKRLCNCHLLWEVAHVFSYRDSNLSRCLSPHSIEPLLFSVSVGSRDAICSEHLYLIQHLIDDVGGRILCTSVGKKLRKKCINGLKSGAIIAYCPVIASAY